MGNRPSGIGQAISDACPALRSGLVLLSLLLGNGGYAGQAVSPQEQRKFDIAVPVLSVADALNMLATQTDTALLFPYKEASSRQANAITGRYTLPEALQVLLEGSGFHGSLSENGAIKISFVGGGHPNQNIERKKQMKTDQVKTENKSKRSIVAGVVAFLAALAPTSPDVTAQERAAGSGGAIILEEVVVTANRRVQNAQEVGKTVNVFNSEALSEGGVEDVSRLALITPGLAFAQRGNDFKLTLRGANAENTDRAEPVPNGVFVDGLYRVRAAQAGNAFLDVESIEVLKGPQGTLFGRNTLGGAILIKTHKPDTEGNAYKINFNYGNYDRRKVDGVINWAVNDDVAFRVAGSWVEADGYIKNLGASNDLGEVDDVAVRAAALWHVTDSVTVQLTHFHYDSGGSALGAYGYQSRGTLRDPDPASTQPISERKTHAFGIYDPVNPRGGALGTRADRGPWEVYRDSPFIRDVTEDTTSLELNWDIGPVSIKSLSAHTDYANLAQVDGDYSEGRLLEESRFDEMEAWSQEVQVSSNTDGRLGWVAGLYYGIEKYSQAFFRTWLGFSGTAAEAAAGTPDLKTCGSAFIPTPRAAVADAANPNSVCPNQFAGNPTDLEASTFGVFIHGSYDVTDALRVNAGVRYSKDDKEYIRGRTLLSTGVLGQTVQTAVSPRSGNDESWDQVTWEVGLEYDVFADSMFYAGVSTGFLSGSFNPNGTTFDQQEVTAYEIGLKNRLFNDRVEVNLSAYRNEFKDLLAGVLDAQSLTRKVNGGSVIANGLEVDAKALFGDSLTVSANLAWQDSTYDEFGAANRFQIGGTGPVGFVDLSGRDTPWAPDIAGNISASYNISAGDLGLVTPYLQLSYSGSHYTTGLQQFDLAKQDAYATLDMRLYWESNNGHWNAQAYVENVTNIAVLQHTIVGGSDIIQVSWGKPRMYGLKVGYTF